jgi:diacylglycerol kinase (ATP)
VRVLAVVNKTAGGPTEDFVGALEAVDTIELEVVWTSGPEDGTRCVVEAAARERPDVVVAIGGDGTAGEVARGVAAVPSRPALLIAPGGTGNSNFRGLWGDLPWPEVVATVFEDRRYAVRPMDLMHLVELDSATLLGVSSGFIPECLVVAQTLPLTGRERLLTAAFQVLNTYVPYPGRVVLDDVLFRECDTLLTVVGGVRYRGGTLQMLPKSYVDDGLLDVCVIDASAPIEAIATAALSEGLVDVEGVHYGRGRRVRLERTDHAPMKLEHDGELETGPRSSYQIEIVPGPITVVVPDPVPACFVDSDAARLTGEV